MKEAVVTVSAPGKVLIAGGYLVMEEEKIGVTISTTSRFFTSIKTRNVVSPNRVNALHVCVLSPQFYSEYHYLLDPITLKLANTTDSSNIFVERCLYLTFAFLSKHYGVEAFSQTILTMIQSDCELIIKLRADNDFYSQTKEVCKVLHVAFIESLIHLCS